MPEPERTAGERSEEVSPREAALNSLGYDDQSVPEPERNRITRTLEDREWQVASVGTGPVRSWAMAAQESSEGQQERGNQYTAHLAKEAGREAMIRNLNESLLETQAKGIEVTRDDIKRIAFSASDAVARGLTPVTTTENFQLTPYAAEFESGMRKGLQEWSHQHNAEYARADAVREIQGYLEGRSPEEQRLLLMRLDTKHDQLQEVGDSNVIAWHRAAEEIREERGATGISTKKGATMADQREERFESAREGITGQEERLREQFVIAQTAGDTSQTRYFLDTAKQINQEIDSLGTRFPEHRETLPPRIDIERLQRSLDPPARERDREMTLSL